MAKNKMELIVIVESPTKAKTISKFLGKGFTVESSYGHIRDLPKSKLGIDVKHDFEPTYVIPKKAEPVVENLKKLSAKADTVILATDEDREGEAIAWHLIQALDLEKADKKKSGAKKIERIAFHEITKDAILEALKNPRALDVNLVNAQQARRVLDRFVGYGLSPFLWRKVRYGLSAGRVQSVAVRFVVERERLIQAFNKEEYWSIEAQFEKSDKRKTAKSSGSFSATLNSINGKAIGKMGILSETEAKDIIESAKGAAYHIAEISVKDVRRYPSPPFTTSTLQQEAARKLGFSAKQTMVLAQRLYENGFITYMRTDSVNLAASALETAGNVIEKEFGRDYRLPEPRRYVTKSKGAQEAHEAIRPTNLAATGGHELGLKERNSERLYDLIWKRTIASQMKEALLEQTSVDIEADTAKKETFRANGQVVKFDGQDHAGAVLLLVGALEFDGDVANLLGLILAGDGEFDVVALALAAEDVDLVMVAGDQSAQFAASHVEVADGLGQVGIDLSNAGIDGLDVVGGRLGGEFLMDGSIESDDLRSSIVLSCLLGTPFFNSPCVIFGVSVTTLRSPLRSILTFSSTAMRSLRVFISDWTEVCTDFT